MNRDCDCCGDKIVAGEIYFIRNDISRDYYFHKNARSFKIEECGQRW